MPLTKVRPYVRYVIFSDNVSLRTVCVRYFAVRCDENKICVISYLQPKFTKVSTECVNDSRKQRILEV